MRDDLKRLASRIGSVTPKDPEQATLYNFGFGAIYALARAEELGYTSHARAPGIGMQRSREVKRCATAMMGRDQLPRKGKWLAGFYFNDALIRADVSYEHVTRYFTKKRNGNIDDLIKKALSRGFPKKMLEPAWRDIRREVNKLKHKSLRFSEGPIIDYGPALIAVSTLIDAVAWVLKRP